MAAMIIPTSLPVHSPGNPDLRVIHEEKRGKGLAVQRGMLEATGDYRFICDVDLSMPIEEVNRFIPPQLSTDISIASREASGAKRYNEPAYRHFIGRVFNLMVRILALPRLQDTQCGFKCFSAQAARELFPLQTITGWTFDVEILYIARKHGYSITELGIPWYHDPHSKVKVFRDSFQMLVDLVSIRLITCAETMSKKFDLSLLPPRPDISFEVNLWDQGITLIAGIDEAGRGAWAGPVYAAAVIFTNDHNLLLNLPGIDDFKKLTPNQRNECAIRIKQAALAWQVGSASSVEIDQLGILPATCTAMKRAVDRVIHPTAAFLIDFLTLPEIDFPNPSGQGRCQIDYPLPLHRSWQKPAGMPRWFPSQKISLSMGLSSIKDTVQLNIKR